jgi:hypothetical protein
VLSVVAILALVAMLVTPNIGALRTRRLRSAGERLAAELELARQRAVVTGIPHRLLFDLDAGLYRIEWLGGQAAGATPIPVAAAAEYELAGSTPLPLAAPETSALDFTPVLDTFGNLRDLEGDVRVAGIETAEGWIARGLVEVVFERDGSADYSEIVLEESGGDHLAMAILPLDDAVRFLDDAETRFQ